MKLADLHTHTSMSTEGVQADRSRSRGREKFVCLPCLPRSRIPEFIVRQVSSGRGGAGNIRPSSQSQDRYARTDGPDELSPTRGRELGVQATVCLSHHRLHVCS